MEKLASYSLRHGALPAQSYRSPWLRSISMPMPRCAAAAATDIAVVSGTSFDLERYLSANARAPDDALALALQDLRCPEALSESMRYAVLAGGDRRLRSALAIAACELVGGPAAAAVPVACAVEMIHAASLIYHDLPCMDTGDALRRGRLPSHVAFGESAAMLAGIALKALAFDHAARGSAGAGVPADRALRAVVELGSVAGGKAAGQAVDTASQGDPAAGSVSLPALECIHVHKAARLVQAAAVSGAIVGGGGDGEVERVRRYAHFLGLLTQLVDDVQDATAASEQLGKTTGEDAAAGKSTYVRVMGMEAARVYIGELLGKAEAELDGINAAPARVAPLRHLARFVARGQR